MNPDLPDFRAARVLVAGDLMLDRYWAGATRRVSPEAPVPVVHVTDNHCRAGGAGNVALNVAALGAECGLLAVVGDDEDGAAVAGLLEAGGVVCHLRVVDGFKTIAKLRVISRQQQLIRLDFEGDAAAVGAGIAGDMAGDLANDLAGRFESLLDDYDVVALSDYDKGALSAVGAMIAACRAAGKAVVVDPKGKDFRRYRGADFITPNMHEFQSVVGECGNDEQIHARGLALARELGLKGLLVTRGAAGMSLIMADGETARIAARAREVFDVTGAGDTVVAVLAVALAAGVGPSDAVRLANAAAGVAVSKLGAVAVSAQELARAVVGDGHSHAILDEAGLQAAVAKARAAGERIVLTNGCFDILHAGHTRYLNQAAALGERLIVAVNTDETVRQLKGAGRPVNPLAQRMAVLAALAAVDWVVAFSEPTPERLICALEPDYLVKGGDNDPDQVPGADCVRAAGGRVLALDYLSDISTTGVIERVRAGQ